MRTGSPLPLGSGNSHPAGLTQQEGNEGGCNSVLAGAALLGHTGSWEEQCSPFSCMS